MGLINVSVGGRAKINSKARIENVWHYGGTGFSKNLW